MDKRQERHIGDHDWHSSEYVNDWIGRDIQRDDERRPLLQQMLERTELASDAEVHVLDVGAGYGVVSEEVLRRFPHARITLLDFSEPMFEQARRRLARHSAQVTFVMGDLSNAQWTANVGGPLRVTQIAHHESELCTVAGEPAARLLEHRLGKIKQRNPRVRKAPQHLFAYDSIA